jgi:hypothetical protein
LRVSAGDCHGICCGFGLGFVGDNACTVRATTTKQLTLAVDAQDALSFTTAANCLAPIQPVIHLCNRGRVVK